MNINPILNLVNIVEMDIINLKHITNIDEIMKELYEFEKSLIKKN